MGTPGRRLLCGASCGVLYSIASWTGDDSPGTSDDLSPLS